MVIPHEVRELAEDPSAHTEVGPGYELVERDGFVLWLGPLAWHANVQRVRVEAEDVPAAVEEVRALIRERGRNDVTWWVGPSARPPDLVARLRELGLVPAEEPPYAPLVTALAITRRPNVGAPAVETRVAETLEDYTLVAEISARAFGFDEEQRQQALAAVPARVSRHGRPGAPVAFIASIGGRAVGTATAVFGDRGALLIGGATLPDARGRGAYRALVAARWDEAVRRGTPALVVHAVETSRAILERLGFERVGPIPILLDRLQTGASRSA